VHACTAWLDDDVLRIRLHHPARGVAKGQAAVLYDGDTVLGSATVSGTSAAAPASGVRQTPFSPQLLGLMPSASSATRYISQGICHDTAQLFVAIQC
jgi:tRNA methyl transferase